MNVTRIGNENQICDSVGTHVVIVSIHKIDSTPMCTTRVQRGNVCVWVIVAVMVGFHVPDLPAPWCIRNSMGLHINRVSTIICNLP